MLRGHDDGALGWAQLVLGKDSEFGVQHQQVAAERRQQPHQLSGTALDVAVGGDELQNDLAELAKLRPQGQGSEGR